MTTFVGVFNTEFSSIIMFSIYVRHKNVFSVIFNEIYQTQRLMTFNLSCPVWEVRWAKFKMKGVLFRLFIMLISNTSDKLLFNFSSKYAFDSKWNMRISRKCRGTNFQFQMSLIPFRLLINSFFLNPFYYLSWVNCYTFSNKWQRK